MNRRFLTGVETASGLRAFGRELPLLARAALWRGSLTRAEVLAYQRRRLRRLVAHAYAEVPYYRELFDARGLRPDDVRDVGDLPAIPISTKRDLQSRAPAEVVARSVKPDRLVISRTSGSTGEPAVIRHTATERLVTRALRRSIFADLGVRARDRVAVLRIPHLGEGPTVRGLGALNALRLYRRWDIDCLQSPERILEEIVKGRPDGLIGFPTVLSRVAEAAREAGGLRVPPRFVITSGEVLTAAMRRDISAGLSAPVSDLYGTYDFSVVAWECREAGTYHTSDLASIVEVLRDGRAARAGERGIVVATALHSFAMPLIRYELGDVVTSGSAPCACGQPFGTVDSIQGRMVDYFPLPDGRLVHPFEIVTGLVQNTAAPLRQYQLIQERLDRVTLRVVPVGTLSPERLSAIHSAVAAILGEGVELEVIPTSEIPLEPSGKFRPSRSLVHSTYDGVRWGDTTPA